MICSRFTAAPYTFAKAAAAFVVGLLLIASSGCATRDCWCFTGPTSTAPVNSVMATWDPHLQTITDTQRPGVQVYGLAGRVYLQSEDAKKLTEAQGDIVVAMYDVTPTASGGKPEPLVQCTFDAKNLKRLLKSDMIGDGYTLFIPWEKYRPDVKRVKLDLAYVEKGTPQYAPPTVLTVDTQGTIQVQTRQITPVSYTPPTK